MFVYDSLLANGTPLPKHAASALRAFPDAGDVPSDVLEQTRSVFGEEIMIGIGMGADGRIIGLDQTATSEQVALVVERYKVWLHENA